MKELHILCENRGFTFLKDVASGSSTKNSCKHAGSVRQPKKHPLQFCGTLSSQTHSSDRKPKRATNSQFIIWTSEHKNSDDSCDDITA